tara:strand:- start:366 stop:548 length:183 start_codon:yes stop_codon:yes gene_type:complete
MTLKNIYMGFKHERTGIYQLIYKGEVIDEAENAKEAGILQSEYMQAFHTNSIKLKFKYDG